MTISNATNDTTADRKRSTLLPFHQAWIDESEIEEVVDTLRSGG